MALSDLTWKLYTDSGLTTLFGGTYTLTHKTDLSDNPQDFQLWFGSTETAHTLEAVSNPGVDQITLTPTDLLGGWTAAHAYTLGQCVEPTSPNGKWYQITTAGTSHATTEPTWPTGTGSTVSDGTCVWTCRGARHPITEIKLAASSGGLAGATGGAALNIGTSLTSGVVNAVEINIRITNTVAILSDDTGSPQISFYINNVQETI